MRERKAQHNFLSSHAREKRGGKEKEGEEEGGCGGGENFLHFAREKGKEESGKKKLLLVQACTHERQKDRVDR